MSVMAPAIALSTVRKKAPICLSRSCVPAAVVWSRQRAIILRFSQMLLNNGELEGARILGRKTVELMTSNHLPVQRAICRAWAIVLHSETRAEGVGMGLGARHNLRRAGIRTQTRHDGVGFGLGGYVLLDPPAAQILGSPGEFGWGGAASTIFWVDQREAYDSNASSPN